MKPLTKRLQRILFLIPYVSKHADGVPLSELAELMGTSTAELIRDVEELTCLGVPNGGPHEFIDIQIEGKGTRSRMTISPGCVLRKPPRLTAAEAYALLLGTSALGRTGIDSFDEALVRAEKKVRALLSTETPRVSFSKPQRERAEALRTVAQASHERRQVELDYASINGQRRKRIVVEPYAMLNHRGSWYVLGKSLTHTEGRIFTFKVERILDAKLLDSQFTVPPSFEVRSFAGKHLFIAGIKPVTITLRLHGSAAERMSNWYRNPKKEKTGTTLVKTKMVVSGWLAAWVLRQGPEVEVVGPPELADRVQEVARRVFEAHSAGERHSG
jgi:predicted DNA-binding transcriptional regulator YafY